MINYPITILTDFGKGSTKYRRQRNDCTVCAVSKAFNMSYVSAHNSFADLGRKTGKRFRFSAWLVGSPLAKGRFHVLNISYNTTIEEFCKEYRVGRFIIRTERPNHVIPIVNGMIYDNRPNKRNKRVVSAWQII